VTAGPAAAAPAAAATAGAATAAAAQVATAAADSSAAVAKPCAAESGSETGVEADYTQPPPPVCGKLPSMAADGDGGADPDADASINAGVDETEDDAAPSYAEAVSPTAKKGAAVMEQVYTTLVMVRPNPVTYPHALY